MVFVTVPQMTNCSFADLSMIDTLHPVALAVCWFASV